MSTYLASGASVGGRSPPSNPWRTHAHERTHCAVFGPTLTCGSTARVAALGQRRRGKLAPPRRLDSPCLWGVDGDLAVFISEPSAPSLSQANGMEVILHAIPFVCSSFVRYWASGTKWDEWTGCCFFRPTYLFHTMAFCWYSKGSGHKNSFSLISPIQQIMVAANHWILNKDECYLLTR